MIFNSGQPVLPVRAEHETFSEHILIFLPGSSCFICQHLNFSSDGQSLMGFVNFEEDLKVCFIPFLKAI